VGELQLLDGGAGGLADHVELALQRVGHDHVVPRPMKIWRITGSLARTAGLIGMRG
jgi:hypothetical protein